MVEYVLDLRFLDVALSVFFASFFFLLAFNDDVFIWQNEVGSAFAVRVAQFGLHFVIFVVYRRKDARLSLLLGCGLEALVKDAAYLLWGLLPPS